MKVLVAVHAGTLSGVDTYAEQVATAGAHASCSITLIALDSPRAEALAARLEPLGVRIITASPVPGSRWRTAARQSPGVAARELRTRLAAALERLGETFDVAHLNHPALTPAARRHCGRVVVAAWFYPHSWIGRWQETWRHTGRRLPRSAGMAFKGLLHYRGDEMGYRQSDCAVAATQRLARQLSHLGICSIASAPPCIGSAASPGAAGPLDGGPPKAPQCAKVVICCGDLTHPRKNVRAGLQALGLVAGAGRLVELDLIGRNADRLHREIERLPATVRVTAPGPLPAAEVRSRFRSADVLLLPSLYEEWGYVAAEAGLEGARVVALPVYPFDEMLTPGLGACAEEMTVAALARALDRTLASRPSRADVILAAEQRFGVAAAAARLVAIWGAGAPGRRRTEHGNCVG